MGLHDGHRERLRARFIKNGLADFEPHTALELLLFYARPRCDTNELAHQLIRHFGSLSAVFDAPIEEIMKVKGMGETSAVLIKLSIEIAAYYMNCRSSPGQILDTTEKAGNYFLPKFFGKNYESVYVASLDDKRKLIRCECISSEGIVNAAAISVKRIVTEAVSANATGILLAHNHPGGVALPSISDKAVTKQAFHALKLINVQLLDHIVVADDDYVSMADSGYIEMISNDVNRIN